MKKNSFILCFCFFFSFSFAQIDTDSIKKKIIEDPEQNFFALLEIFKTDPDQLTQEQLNQLYYGSKFVKVEYIIGDYHSESGTFWKSAQKKLSKKKAEKMVREAETKYLKNPLNKNLLDDMVRIYSALHKGEKAYLCAKQKELILQTIMKSGDGKSENTAICVLTAREVFQQLEALIRSGPTAPFDQKMKQLPDGSILTVYNIGERQVFVKLVGGYFL